MLTALLCIGILLCVAPKFEQTATDKPLPAITPASIKYSVNSEREFEEINGTESDYDAAFEGMDFYNSQNNNLNITLTDLLAGDDKFTKFPFEDPSFTNKTIAVGAIWLEDAFNTIIGYNTTIFGEIFLIQESPHSKKTRVFGWARNLIANSLYQLTIGRFGDLQSNHSCDHPHIYHIGNNKSNIMNVHMTSNASGVGLVDDNTEFAPLYGKYSVIGRMLLVRRVELKNYALKIHRNNVTGELESERFDFHLPLHQGEFFYPRDLIPIACGVIGIASDFNVVGPNLEFYRDKNTSTSLFAGQFTLFVVLFILGFA